MTTKELAKRIRGKSAPCVVDVRSGFEYRSGHIPGAEHAPFLTVLLHLKKLPRDRKAPVVVACEHGPRAQLAAAMLRAAGFVNLELLQGHMAGWRRAGLPLERPKG